MTRLLKFLLTPSEVYIIKHPRRCNLRPNLRIVQRRKVKKLTQEELANRCATTQQTIAKIEQGSVDPKLSTLQKIADALECELHELFYSHKDFAFDVNTVVEKLDLNLSKVNPVDLNHLCWKEAFIPIFHPFWSQYKIKQNKIQFK